MSEDRPDTRVEDAAKPQGRTIYDHSMAERIDLIGHRAYVGGSDPETWYGIGILQYHFLVANGLRPEHQFLDIACGSLRLGQYLIPYLDRGKYLGIDMIREIIDAGLAHEISPAIVEMKAPDFVVNEKFDVSGKSPFDVAIAQSLFTHLTLEDIGGCAAALWPNAAPGAKFYFTYFEGGGADNPDGGSDPHKHWFYDIAQIADHFAPAGWQVSRIGDWNHPRDQKMAVAEKPH